MHRLIEILFGLQRGFLSREGDFSVEFNPRWPAQDIFGAVGWNVLLVLIALALVVVIYRRDARSSWQRIMLGTMRLSLFLLVIALLNHPVVKLGQSRTEPSILPVLLDDSLSMRIADMGTSNAKQSRLGAAVDLFIGRDQSLLRELSKVHTLKFFRFDTNAAPVESPAAPLQPTTAPVDPVGGLAASLAALKPIGQSTEIGDSIAGVLDDLQGQRVAGIVLLTDGRDAPAKPIAKTLAALKEAGVRVFPIAIGSDRVPMNVELRTATAEDSAFVGDIVDVKGTLRATGITQSEETTIHLVNKRSGLPLIGIDGQPAAQRVAFSNDQSVDFELPFKPSDVGTLDVQVMVDRLPDETDTDDNARTLQVSVLDAKITLLFVDGYPRWDYRYLKNEMIRDKTMQISCLLTSADPTFRQEGTKPITRFPESMDELLDYDVVIFGDVDSTQFSD
ncbi:MAG: VWA domain-containing protein, partial [Phycisphaerae bacterium]|nr:VWA domain-containing protein [Phycisphaerae bacterium]